jgi:hypothetical protein
MKRKDFADAQQAQLKHKLDSYEDNQRRFAADAVIYKAKMMELAQKYKDETDTQQRGDMEYKIKDGEIYKDDHRLHSFGVTYSNLSVMDKKLLLTVGRHFEELKNGIHRKIAWDDFNCTFKELIGLDSHRYLNAEVYAEYLASYLALKDDRLEALHEVIRKLEEAAKGLADPTLKEEKK